METVAPRIDAETRSHIDIFAVWCGIGYILMLLVGWAVVAGFFPPPHPDAGQDEIVALFQRHYIRIRIGMIIVMFGALVFVPFGAIIALQVQKIEGGVRVLTISTIMICIGNMILTFVPAMTWTVASFRPNRDPGVTYALSDMAFLWFIGGASILLMMIPIAVAAFVDKGPDPAFPRWFGYLNLWVVLLIVPDQLLFFFHQGPFSWNGIVGLWIPLGVFTIWFVTTFYLLRQAVLGERRARLEVTGFPGVVTENA
jgi:hypothetical protein